MISIMIIQEVINYTTGSPIMFDVRLVIGKSSFKINSRTHSLQTTSNTSGKINNLIGGASEKFPNLKYSSRTFRNKSRTLFQKNFFLTTIISLGFTLKTTCGLSGQPTFERIRRGCFNSNIGVQRVREKLTQFSEKFDVPVECIVEALEICLYRHCSTYQGQYWLQTDGTAMGPKNSCSYADIVAECVDLRVLEAKINFPELRSWFHFRDDTFVLWRGTVERLNNFFTVLNSFDQYLKFTMDIGGKSLNFLDLAISIEGNSLVTSVYSKPTDAHLYLDAKSCHPKSQILGIAKSVALRVRRICSDEDDFHKKSAEYANYLIACGHDSQHVMSKFNEVATMTRQEARKNKNKGNKNRCIFAIKYNPRGPDIRKILKRHYKDVIANDEKAVEILPEGAICVAYKRNGNLKELLAPSNSFKRRLSTEPTGCFKCKAKRCDCCQNFFGRGFYFYFEKYGKSISNWEISHLHLSIRLFILPDVLLVVCKEWVLLLILKLDLPITSLTSNIIGEPVV